MTTWTLAAKDLRLLVGDRRAVVILLVMPILFILVLGIALGDNPLRITVVDQDHGPWSLRVQKDLKDTAGIVVEVLESEEEAQRLVNNRKRAAVLVFGPDFSQLVDQCSFLKDGINPFYRYGVNIDTIDARLLRDRTQGTAASIIEQVAQGTLLRVILPWMIGSAFEKIGDKDFMKVLGKNLGFPLPGSVGPSVQKTIQELYPKYNLTGKTWEDLTTPASKKNLPAVEQTENQPDKPPESGQGPTDLLKYGDLRYQNLVPSYTVMFAFFLVLTVGWLFVAERRQGTLKRLRAAPISPTQILVGKLIPCLVLSVGQGLFLLAAGKVVFGLDWGVHPLGLVAVVLATSLAATGLAILVASLARTEAQVAIYGTLLVLVLAGISGCLMGDPELMPEQMKQLSRITPHAWALDAYSQLLLNPNPNLALVGEACGVLTAFGVGFFALAWWLLKLD